MHPRPKYTKEQISQKVYEIVRTYGISMLTAREACDALAEACKAEAVQVIGTKFVLYKRNEKEPKIELVKSRKK